MWVYCYYVMLNFCYKVSIIEEKKNCEVSDCPRL